MGVTIEQPAKVSRCATCEAEIYWLRHAFTGNIAPIDAATSPDGNCVLDLERSEYELRVTKAGRHQARDVGIELHMPHFATCPGADKHRRRR